jgi:DNA polymerase-3 subunit epsilon
MSNRHRALGDTEATAILFKLMFASNVDSTFEQELTILNKEAKLPANLSGETYNNLPEKCGVYYFYNENKDVVYVGKSKNIKKRITQHFTSVDSTSRKNNMMREIADISYELTGSELVALLKESEEIKLLSPKFNRAQRRIRFNIGIIQYQDQNGYLRLGIDRKSITNAPSYLKFTSQSEARSFLHYIVKKGNLCQKLVGLQTGKGACFEQQLGMCNGACTKTESPAKYNARVKKTIESYSLAGDSYLIKDIGRSDDEYSVTWVQNGAYQGYGYFSNDIYDTELIKEGIKRAMDNRDVIGIIKSFLNKNALEVIPIKNTEQHGMLF